MDSNKARQKATPSLPTEVMTEILSWLPLKPLARAQLVSREFGALIQDHQFTEKHMSRTTCVDHWYNVVATYSEYAKAKPGFCYLHGCDGLILLKNRLTHTRTLWNPASRLLLHLPPLPQKRSFGFALSFVPSTKTYKIASFFKDRDSGTQRCQVLTPGPSMEWRRLEFPELVNANAPAAETNLVVPAGGDAHCAVVNRVGEETVAEIVSLDLETEILTLNRLPGGVFGDVGAARTIDCNGKLGFVVVDKEEMQEMVLQDFKKGRWCRNKEVIPLPFLKDEGYKGRNVVVLLIKEGEVWFWLEDEKVFVYTVETGEIFDVFECKRLSVSDKLYIYKPSLVGFEGMIADDEIKNLRRPQILLD